MIILYMNNKLADADNLFDDLTDLKERLEDLIANFGLYWNYIGEE